MATIAEVLQQAGLSARQSISDALRAFNLDPATALPFLEARGISPQTSIIDLMTRLGISTSGSLDDVLGSLNQIQPSGGQPPVTSTPPPSTPPPAGAAPPGAGGQTVASLLQQYGLSLRQPVGDLIRGAIQQGLVPPNAQEFLAAKGINLGMSGAEFLSQLQLDPNTATYDTIFGALDRIPTIGGAPPPGPPPGGGTPPGQFPQTPPITLPPGQQPTPFPTLPPPALPSAPPPFQPVPPPTLPTQITLPPELSALFANMQATLQAQQAQRESALSQVQRQIQEQEATRAANQPMLDAAIANIQSVLTGQAASPGLEGLVSSAFAPAEAEGARRLRQTAEEAAALRGMTLTDTPIGQPYLEEVRRMGETFGGQRSQALIGLREQDAAFSQRVREFQEGLRQQALTNRMDVVRSLGTPEQAAQVLGNLGLGARQAALGEFGARGQQALSASDLALRQALGQSSAGLQQFGLQSQNALGLGNLNLQQALGQTGANLAQGQFGLASQAQGFQQQLAKQQASIQNQLSLLGALGDPFSSFGGMSQVGFGGANQSLQNQMLLANAFLGGGGMNFGNPGFTQTTTGQQPSNVLGNLGIGALGTGALLGTSIGGGATLGSALWGLLAGI